MLKLMLKVVFGGAVRGVRHRQWWTSSSSQLNPNGDCLHDLWWGVLSASAWTCHQQSLRSGLDSNSDFGEHRIWWIWQSCVLIYWYPVGNRKLSIENFLTLSELLYERERIGMPQQRPQAACEFIFNR